MTNIPNHIKKLDIYIKLKGNPHGRIKYNSREHHKSGYDSIYISDKYLITPERIKNYGNREDNKLVFLFNTFNL